jgi:hypothetical protein
MRGQRADARAATVTRALPALALAAGLAIAAGAAPARAQSSAPVDSVRYRAPDGTLVTITENERQNRMADLNDLLFEVARGGRKMIFDAGGKMVIIETSRLNKIALWLVANGGLTPGQIPAWQEEQVNKAIRARDALVAELAALKTASTINPETPPPSTPPPAPPSNPPAAPLPTDGVAWPDPMDWLKVRGETRGTFLVECDQVKRTGPFRLALAGDGSVSGVFDDFPNYRYAVTGTILADGTASGRADAAVPREVTMKWTATFQRSGSALLMAASTLDLQPFQGGILIDCKPGSMSQIRE